jgi:tRNA/rRNA methyltransferase
VVTSLDVFTPKKPRGSGAPEGRARKPAPEDKAE